MNQYLQLCARSDYEDRTTGRCVHSFMSGTYAQITATKRAWNAVFERLACGWEYNEALADEEPFVTLALIRLFFENSDEAFLKAERGELPVPKPAITANATPTSPSYQIISPTPLYP